MIQLNLNNMLYLEEFFYLCLLGGCYWASLTQCVYLLQGIIQPGDSQKCSNTELHPSHKSSFFVCVFVSEIESSYVVLIDLILYSSAALKLVAFFQYHLSKCQNYRLELPGLGRNIFQSREVLHRIIELVGVLPSYLLI